MIYIVTDACKGIGECFEGIVRGHTRYMENIQRRAVVSLFSSYASQLATTGANLATKLILARLIAPDDLGVYALAMLIMLCADMLVDLGISQHIVREEHRPYGNFLLLRLAIAFAFFIGIQFAAPMLKYWGPVFPSVVRSMALVPLIKAVSGVPNVYLDRELLIHRSLLPQLARIFSMGLVSCGLAYFHYGVWALVWGTVAAEALFAILIWNSARHHLHIEFTWKHTRSLVWGSRLLFLIGVMGLALQQGDVAIIGGLLTPRDVGYYTMALTIIVMVSKVVETAVFRVVYPMFCEYSQNLEALGRIYRTATLAIISVEAPIYFYLLFNAPTAVTFMLGRKWLQSAMLIRALSVFGIIYPFSTFGNEVLRARKQDKVLICSSAIGTVTLLTFGYILTRRYGVMGVVAAHYIALESIPVIIRVYQTVRRDFLQLAVQLAIVYASSLAGMAVVSLSLSSSPVLAAVLAGLLIPACWYIYYRAFANGLGRKTITAFMATRGPVPTELSPQGGSEPI